MTRGILIISCGETDAYLPALVASITKHTALPIHIHRDPRRGGIDSRSVKLQMHKLSPFDQTLCVDCDTLFCADPEPIFDLLQHAPVWMAIDVGPRTVSEMLDHPFFKTHLAVPVKKKLQFVAKRAPDFPHFNSGVVLFSRGGDADHFMTAWHRVWSDLPPGQDQVALVLACHATGFRPASLSVRWNYQHNRKQDEKDLATHRSEIRILHLLGSEKGELYRRARVNGFT